MKQTKIDRFTIDRIAITYEDISNKLIGKLRRKKLNNTDFSIISNNCWGGHVYRRYSLPYSSPTVGMYFFSEEYIRFLQNLEMKIHAPIEVISASESKYREELYRKGQERIPIGVLDGDTEIVFLHYKDASEVKEKWNRRVKRVNFDNLIVKFSEQNLCEKKHIDSFVSMSFKKKILLLAEPYDRAPEGIVVKRYSENGVVNNDTAHYSSFINLEQFINR